MSDAVLLTTEGGGPETVLPSLSLLSLNVENAPLTISAVVAHLDAPVLIVDGRRDLVSARTICRAADEMAAPPILLVLNEGGYAVVSATWGAADTTLFSASPAELQARIRMLTEHSQAKVIPVVETDSVDVGCLHIDPGAFVASIAGRRLDLTYKEFELLRYLAGHADQVVTRDSLLEDVWGFDYYGGSRTVDVHVRRLRAKLGTPYDSMISTVRNVGYRLDSSVS